MDTQQRRLAFAILATVVAVVFFLVDLRLPLGVAAAVPYVTVVLIGLLSPRRTDILVFATVCSVLTIFGYVGSPGGGELWKVIANRALALYVIWAIALLGYFLRRKDSALRASESRAASVAEHRDKNVDPILQVTTDGIVTYANPASVGLLAFWATTLGRSVPKLWRGRATATLDSGRPADFELDCGERVLRVTVVPDASGSLVEFFAHDITDQKRLQVDRERMGRALEQSLNEVFVFDATTLRFIEVNRGARRNLGYTLEELQKLTPVDIKPQLSEDAFEKLVAPLRAGAREKLQFETVHGRKDGSTYPVEVHLQLCAGEAPFFVAIVLDITERIRSERKLLDSERRIRAWLEHSPVCTKIVDLKFNLQYMSYAGVRGLNIADITQYYGKPYPFDFFPKAFRDSMTKNLEKVRDTGEVATQEAPVSDTDGNTLWFHSTLVPVKDDGGRVEYIMVVSVNTTERKQAELELVEARRIAESANKAKSEFLANMSHEIRTPMTAILGFAENMEDPELSEREKLESVRTIRQNGEHLLAIINDILDLSKIEAGKMSVDRVNCHPSRVIAEVASLVQTQVAAKQLLFTMEYATPIPETIKSDPMRLRQILLNLVGNAVKFTDAGEVCIVAAFVNRYDASFLRFDVSDTGRGMTGKQASHIFAEFSQADASTSREFGGTGLGLTISKRLAKLLGGDVELIQTKFNEGSVFRATVATGPVNGVKMLTAATPDGSDRPAGPVSTAHNDLQGCRILLAEDNYTNQILIVGILEKAGAMVKAVKDGWLAFDAATAARDEGATFDVILMDMQMPVMDGYESTRLLREKGYTRPIIALTANTMDSDRDRCLTIGCDDFVPKPINRALLIEIIRAHWAMATENPVTCSRS